jgi:hypothetical protein
LAVITAKATGGNFSAPGTWDTGTVPTAADDVKLAATSGNVTIDVNSVCRSFDCTGYTGTLTHASGVTLAVGDGVGGMLKLVPGMTYTAAGGSAAFTFVSTSNNGGVGWPITLANKAIGSLAFNGAGGKWQLQDTPTTTFTGSGATTHASISLLAGTLDVNGKGFTTGSFTMSGSTTRALVVGAPCTAAMIYNGGAPWSAGGINLTTSGLTSLAITLGAPSTAATFAGGGLSYGSLSFTPAGSGSLAITGNNSYGALDIEATTAKPLTLPAGGTQTISGTTTLHGTALQLLNLVSSVRGTPTTINVQNGDFSHITNITNSVDIVYTGRGVMNLSGASSLVAAGHPSVLRMPRAQALAAAGGAIGVPSVMLSAEHTDMAAESSIQGAGSVLYSIGESLSSSTVMIGSGMNYVFASQPMNLSAESSATGKPALFRGDTRILAVDTGIDTVILGVN